MLMRDDCCLYCKNKWLRDGQDEEEGKKDMSSLPVHCVVTALHPRVFLAAVNTIPCRLRV